MPVLDQHVGGNCQLEARRGREQGAIVADAEIGDLSEAELDQFEALIEVPDRDLFKWLTGEVETPSNYDTSVWQRVRAFHRHDAPIHS